ncbi:hydantoinase/oxoprolinase family protein [Conexibacter stalactiti]|uniref:Hydantoinase/oxoprolinase family protein n=1 Tax=Conexibacter stalactiti TaxID=1940611 RepID=A0ABU4HSL1_9ACTN|nr:hydantoinase/oxoprolinase family protein [Conexibacter stalactiti]MDW5596307.1 hydantoinase/oxoprolinase family protein [Conexibacter stalactiti]MEC5036949.1 hydantoinase/oxoprolinase family protein [Conexibacter stalactiti]
MPLINDNRLRFGVDTGGTFTDLVVAGDSGGLRIFKRPTTPADPVEGLLDALDAAAQDFGCTRQELLARGDQLVFGTTRATNAIVEGATARTALLTTAGHPDTLTLREGGGRPSLFDYSHEYPAPYVPRALTFEIPERVGAGGEIVTPLDEAKTRALLRTLPDHHTEAIAVCLLWSIVEPAHELRLGELIAEELPGIPFTLSHQLNPALREYRRTSSAAIDASLKPLMSTFLQQLGERLRGAGFEGRLLIMTSSGGTLDAHAVAAAPIHSIGSGPAAAPVAGRHFAQLDAARDTAIVTDAGGTTYDVSVLRDGVLPWTRESVVGHPTFGFTTGFPSVDTTSIGAGGGSIAWVDDGGLLHVGPQSAGADPGPACYARGGVRATVTDACVALGWIDPAYFLGGELTLDGDAARAALQRDVGGPLGLDVEAAAAAVVQLAVERMVRVIEELTLQQGIEPAGTVMIGGGGGSGLYSCAIARRLGSPLVALPAVAATLSATGVLLSDLQTDVAETAVLSSGAFDHARAEQVLRRLELRCREFAEGPGAGALGSEITYSVEARYPQQVWEIELPLRSGSIATPADVATLREDFHRLHESLFAVADRDAEVELVTWRARIRCDLGSPDLEIATPDASTGSSRPQSDRGVAVLTTRRAHFAAIGTTDVPVHRVADLSPGDRVEGPAFVESPVTTVVVEPGASAELAASGTLLLRPLETNR